MGLADARITVVGQVSAGLLGIRVATWQAGWCWSRNGSGSDGRAGTVVNLSVSRVVRDNHPILARPLVARAGTSVWRTAVGTPAIYHRTRS
jgi:hypothetical protein